MDHKALKTINHADNSYYGYLRSFRLFVSYRQMFCYWLYTTNLAGKKTIMEIVGSHAIKSNQDNDKH